MAAELIGGAALGVVVEELVSAILDLGERALKFSPVLKDVKSKLEAITPLVKQIDELNDAMDYPKQETEKLRDLMVEGKQLLVECGDVKLGKLSYLKKPFYTQKLRDLDGALRSFMDILLLQMARDQKKNLQMMNQLMEIIRSGGLGKQQLIVSNFNQQQRPSTESLSMSDSNGTLKNQISSTVAKAQDEKPEWTVQDEKPEWTVQDEPGVYLTLTALPVGGNELKRVRFSRRRFTEEQAEKWWAEFGTKVRERHNVKKNKN